MNFGSPDVVFHYNRSGTKILKTIETYLNGTKVGGF